MRLQIFDYRLQSAQFFRSYLFQSTIFNLKSQIFLHLPGTPIALNRCVSQISFFWQTIFFTAVTSLFDVQKPL